MRSLRCCLCKNNSEVQNKIDIENSVSTDAFMQSQISILVHLAKSYVYFLPTCDGAQQRRVYTKFNLPTHNSS